MAGSLFVKSIDYIIKPSSWYKVQDLVIQGHQLIATRDDQNNAGLIGFSTIKDPATSRARRFGPNPIKPYRDYYGHFKLITRLVPTELDVKFAIGYTLHSKVVTVDDYSNFGWLRLATGKNDIIYPNLSDHKQLLDFLLDHSKLPKFIVTRIYHDLQNYLYQDVTQLLFQIENGTSKKACE